MRRAFRGSALLAVLLAVGSCDLTGQNARRSTRRRKRGMRLVRAAIGVRSGGLPAETRTSFAPWNAPRSGCACRLHPRRLRPRAEGKDRKPGRAANCCESCKRDAAGGSIDKR